MTKRVVRQRAGGPHVSGLQWGVVCWLGAVSSDLVNPASTQGSVTNIPYQGTALHDTALIRRVQFLVRAVDGPASVQAESLTGLPLDRSRLKLVLDDVPIGLTRFHASMSAGGHDSITVSVHAQYWLRSAGPDSLAALRTLIHEYVHAILRQHMQPEHYGRLPEWLQEGIATYLSGEHADRLWVALAHQWDDPQSLYVGLGDGPAVNDRVAGSWWFAALDSLYGEKAVRQFLATLVAERSPGEALAAFGCTIEDAWRMAEQMATAEVQPLTLEVAVPLRECLGMRSEEPERCRKCLGELIRRHPGTYAAEYALYWAAKVSYERQYLQEARKYLDAFAACPRDYGLADTALYLRLRIAAECRRLVEARRYCEEYYELWPDGQYWGMVGTICRELN
jgi:tetratricopeptide (TPR) repeat protein